MIKLYNTLTKSVQTFKPLDDTAVTIYSCGPTVYDNVTIGNLRSYVIADTLNRMLELSGHKVKHAMNMTDIDDKTIARSHNDFPEDSSEIALKKLTEIYELSFMEDMKRVGNRLDRYDFIRASESIDLMQELINELLDKKFAYIADDGIYFSIEEYKKSGKKYGQLLELDTSNTSKSRINNDEYDKNSVHDFALWKFMRPNEPAWSYLINGKDYIGRPGWHIECSAMSVSKLGQPFDIHTGGVDLIFPHHENEIAQSTAGNDNPVFANYFVHNEHILVDGRKISKSLSNGYTIGELTERGYDPLAYRLFILQSHYRSHADFNFESLDAAQNRLNKLKNLSEMRWQVVEGSYESYMDFDKTAAVIKEDLENDLNTPKVLATLSSLQKKLEFRTLNGDESKKLENLIKLVDNVLGLGLTSIGDITDNLKDLISKRQEARKDKDWGKSDKIRDELLEKGISINDTSFGSVWYRAY